MTPELSAALVKAQQQLHAPTKNREVTVRSDKGSYKFSYSTLDEIVERVLRPVLPDLGLWFVQFVADGQMVTRIIHESGGHLDCGLPMPGLPNKPQEAGSLISYYKRYSLCAAFGLVAEEDDDANIAQGNGYEAKDRGQKPSEPAITDDQFKELIALAEQAGADNRQFCKFFKIDAARNLPASKFIQAMDMLRSKLPAEKEAA